MTTFVCIDGQRFSYQDVLVLAKYRGWVHSDDVLRRRLKGGASTWAELLCEPRKFTRTDKFKDGLAKRSARQAEARREMAELCRQLDARRKL